MRNLIVSGSFAVLMSAVGPVFAQVHVISFDENANGTFATPTVGSVPLPVTASSPPVYHLAALLGFAPTPGDIVLTEGVVGSNLGSDLLRFDANGNVTVFSDRESTDVPPFDLADVGIPAPITALPVITLPETDPTGKPPVEGGIDGLFNYVPAPGTPGSSPTGALVIYNFTSDVPEPASLSTLVIATGAMLARRSRKTA